MIDVSATLPEWVPEAFRAPTAGLVGVATGFLAAIAFRTVGLLWMARRHRVTTDETFRKLDAKKHNEHLKLIGSFSNTVGAAIIGAAFIVPYIGNHIDPALVDARWVGVGLALPLAGHFALRFMKSES